MIRTSCQERMQETSASLYNRSYKIEMRINKWNNLQYVYRKETSLRSNSSTGHRKKTNEIKKKNK